MPDVLLVESGDSPAPALGGLRHPHVPVRYQLHAVGVGVHRQQDDVIQEPQRFPIVAAEHLVDGFHQLVGTEDLRGVQSAVDPDDGLALLGQGAGVVIRQPLGEGQPPGNVLVPGEVPVVFRRRDDGHEMGASFGGPADLLEHHARRLALELAPVCFQLGVVGEVIVVADVEAELLERGGDVRLRLERGRGHPGDGDGDEEPEERGVTDGSAHGTTSMEMMAAAGGWGRHRRYSL